jgi:hypothetical protein
MFSTFRIVFRAKAPLKLDLPRRIYIIGEAKLPVKDKKIKGKTIYNLKKVQFYDK